MLFHLTKDIFILIIILERWNDNLEPLDYLKKLEDKGYKAYIVGGYVRDMLLGIESSDVDIATNAKPFEVTDIFDESNQDNVGVVNIKTDKLNIDITTFRKESKYIGHIPKKYSYVNDLETDLRRRDFTINTICLNSKGEIVDLMGGRKDLEKHLLRCVGSIKYKFKEDPLRMLRALRFAIIYKLEIGKNELIFIVNNKKLLNNVSYDRKKDEIGKILISKNAVEGLILIKNLGLLDILGIDFDRVVKVDDYIGMWAQLSFSDKYSFSRKQMKRIEAIREIINNKEISKKTIFKYGYYDTFVASMILGYDESYVGKLSKDMQIKSESDLDITGDEIIKVLKLDNNKKIKVIKNDIIKEILENNIDNEKEKIIKYIEKKWK